MTVDTDTERWKKFGRWLRAARMDRQRQVDLTRAELAKVCGVHDNSWANWERGGRNMSGHWIVYRPKPENLYGIARALDIAPADVFRRAGVRMDDDVLSTIGPDGEDKLDQLLDMVKVLVDRLAPLTDADGAVAEVQGKLRALEEERPRRRGRSG